MTYAKAIERWPAILICGYLPDYVKINKSNEKRTKIMAT